MRLHGLRQGCTACWRRPCSLRAGAEAERGEALDDYNEAIARVAALRRGARGCAALEGGVGGGVRAARGTRGGDSLSLCANVARAGQASIWRVCGWAES